MNDTEVIKHYSDLFDLLKIATLALERISNCEGAPDIDPIGDWQFGLHCGLEDRGLHNRYDCANYGHSVGAERCLEWAADEAKFALKKISEERDKLVKKL